MKNNTEHKPAEDRDAIIKTLRDQQNVSMSDPDMPRLAEVASEAFKVLKDFNLEYDLEKGRALFGTLIGKDLDETTTVYPPFYTNYGKNISLGKGVFINHDCSMLDLGGIEIEDEVMIGPRVSITSENHPISPKERKTLVPGKVTIKKNAWIGSNVNILPGVTIGEHSVVAAGAVVTKNVPPRTLVGGIPAKELKKLED